MVIYKPQDKQFLRRDQRGLRLCCVVVDSQSWDLQMTIFSSLLQNLANFFTNRTTTFLGERAKCPSLKETHFFSKIVPNILQLTAGHEPGYETVFVER